MYKVPFKPRQIQVIRLITLDHLLSRLQIHSLTIYHHTIRRIYPPFLDEWSSVRCGDRLDLVYIRELKQ